MRAVSAAYLRAQTGSGNSTVRIRPCNPYGAGGRDSNGWIRPAAGPLPVTGGALVLDGTADLRMRTEGLELAPYWPDTGQDRANTAGRFGTAASADSARPGTPVWPRGHLSPVTPYGRILLVELGVELGGGNVEYARAGYVRIDSLDQPDEPDGPISVEASDLSAFLADSGMVYDLAFPAGTTMQEIFERLVISDNGSWRGLPLGFDAADIDLDPEFAASTLGAARATEGDRLGFLAGLAADRGRAMWWDGRGKLVTRKPSDPGVPVLDIGGPNPLATPLTRTGRSLTRDGVRNIVIAEQSSITAGAGARAIAAWSPGGANDGASMYTFGLVPERFSSPLITSQATAERAAQTRLGNLVSLPDRRTVRHAVNGAIEPGDIARVWPRGSSDPAGWQIREVTATRIPLVPGEEQVTEFRDLRVTT